MKYSIIIPTYNEEKVIEGGIRQFDQYKSLYDLEVVVSDGCSKDNTAKIAKRFADKVIVEEGKTNIPTGRNIGAKHATGEYLIFIDSDVRIPDVGVFLQKIESYFRKIDVVGITPVLEVYPEIRNRVDRIFHSAINLWFILSSGIGIYWGRGECQIIRRDTFEKLGGYDQSLVASEDNDLLLRAKKIGKVIYPRDLVIYHSARRFKKKGYFKVMIMEYALNTLSYLFLRKSYSREWEEIR